MGKISYKIIFSKNKKELLAKVTEETSVDEVYKYIKSKYPDNHFDIFNSKNENITPYFYTKSAIRYQSIEFQQIQNVKNITKKPLKGEIISIITEKSFNTISLVDFLLDDEIAENAIITTYSMNEFSAKRIFKLVEMGVIKKLSLIVGKVFAEHQRAMGWFLMLKENKNPNIKIKYTENHSKIFACLTNKGNYYCSFGSGNFSANGRIENYHLLNDENQYKMLIKLDKYVDSIIK